VKCDVVIVGAGPSGAAAAHHLARRQLDVVLVDKESFPREKVCGDGLTSRAVTLLREMGVRDCLATNTPIGGVRVFDVSDGSLVASAERSPGSGSGLVVRRFDLDHEVCQRATDAGACFLPATTVQRLARDRSGRVLGVDAFHDGRPLRIEAAATIVAEGSKGRLGAEIRGPERFAADIGYAVRQYADGVTGVVDTFDVYFPIRLDDHVVAGYAWIFPAGDLVNVGAGFFYGDRQREKINVRALYAQALADLRARFPDLAGLRPVSPLIGAPLRIGLEPRRTAAPGVLLVGDAAAVINPFTGEGIAYALETGRLAAGVVHDALDGTGSLAAYPEALAAEYPRHANLRLTLPRLFGLAERHLGRLFGRMARGISNTKSSGGAIGRATRRLLSDRAPAVPEAHAVGGLSTLSPAAHAFVQRMAERVLTTIATADPLLAETCRYLLGSQTTMVLLPSAVAHAAATALGYDDQTRLADLAEADELLALGQFLLSDVKPADGERMHEHYNGLALLWGDMISARSLVQLFALPQVVIPRAVEARIETFARALAARRPVDLAAGPAPALAVHCVPVCAATAEAVALLAGAGDASGWLRDFVTHLATGHERLADVVVALLGDEARGLRPIARPGKPAAGEHLLAAAEEALDAAEAALATCPASVRTTSPLCDLVGALRLRAATVATLSRGAAAATSKDREVRYA
jgi:geranylgeranyl reductase family protein